MYIYTPIVGIFKYIGTYKDIYFQLFNFGLMICIAVTMCNVIFIWKNEVGIAPQHTS